MEGVQAKWTHMGNTIALAQRRKAMAVQKNESKKPHPTLTRLLRNLRDDTGSHEDWLMR